MVEKGEEEMEGVKVKKGINWIISQWNGFDGGEQWNFLYASCFLTLDDVDQGMRALYTLLS